MGLQSWSTADGAVRSWKRSSSSEGSCKTIQNARRVLCSRICSRLVTVVLCLYKESELISRLDSSHATVRFRWWIHIDLGRPHYVSNRQDSHSRDPSKFVRWKDMIPMYGSVSNTATVIYPKKVIAESCRSSYLDNDKMASRHALCFLSLAIFIFARLRPTHPTSSPHMNKWLS